MKRLLTVVVALSIALLPGVASAAEEDEGDLLLRINGNVTVAKGETVGTVIVINGDATVEGTVKDAVVVINGNAVIEGTVGEDVTVINGTADIRSGATVKNVHSVNGSVDRAQGANVTGDVNENAAFKWEGGFGGVAAAFSIFIWVGVTIVMVVAGLVFAAIGGRQLTSAARALTGELAGSIVGGVVVWIALPILAFVLLLTVVGIPLSLGTWIFLLPTLWFLGYIVAGARLGGALVGLRERAVGSAHPYAATVLGVVLLQLVSLVPVIGWLVAAVAGLWGAGALAYIAWRAMRGGGASTVMAAPATTA